MRILIVSTYFPPQNSISSLRPYSWAKHWSRLGMDVTVLTCAIEEDPALALDKDCSGFSVVRVAAPALVRRLRRFYAQSVRASAGSSKGPTKGPNKSRIWLKALVALRTATGIAHATRMPDPMDLWIGPAVRAIRACEPFDVVVSTAGPYATHLVAAKVKRMGMASHWFADYRDLWADSELFPGLFPFNWYERRLESRLMRQAVGITAVTPGQREKLAERHGSEKVFFVPNGFEAEDQASLELAPTFPQDGKIRLVYTGMIYEGKRDPSPLFAAIQRIVSRGNEPPIEVVFAGALMGNLSVLIERYSVQPYVSVRGMVSRKEALRMQRDASALLFLECNQNTALTGKLFEYLASGRPILAVGVDRAHAAGALIHEAQSGVAVGTDVTQIEELLKSGLEIKVSPRAEVIARYERGPLAKRYLEIVQQRTLSTCSIGRSFSSSAPA